ncbi:zinc finger FYVE domain-containing protein 1-like isoform X1 [Bradysia coprophila]|uniref:zinc finger FYVE domain-containing protein 1-like isoform X1 n=1 Tax=Bradysia coprophila TaxID=38358 RepID=UPI00187DBECC|nr:zinc finger FYVE domain-containing protein 1-like isoform X1 [Bradysia coprophila]XP_037029787.1 zinc finger FYVE domain-containing protein 1-like isoform X1 [Bradysia coprophila]
MSNMTKHNNFKNDSPSIMEPLESPSLTLESDLNDAIQTDILGDALSSIRLNSNPMRPMYITNDTTNLYTKNDPLSNVPPNTPLPMTAVFDNDYQRKPTKTLLLHHTADELNSINMHYEKSFLLMDGKERLCVPTAELFCKQLGCKPDSKIKVVSIFGNTGDGKSHTMNHLFFDGATEEVFRTSESQDSCTLGVWAAYQPTTGVLCLDTEGLLGITENESRRMRMLLKLLAISDIVIYRTRSERLHSDMFTFLGTASQAFCKFFSAALQSFELPGSPQALGPAVIIFHETRNTKVIEASGDKSAEDILRERFAAKNSNIDAFSSIRYVGVQTSVPPTNYTFLTIALNAELNNTTVRSRRQPEVVFKALDALNMKFNGKISETSINPFPEQYFTCGVHCESCKERCERSMGHVIEGEEHRNKNRCRYQHQFENKVYLCRMCLTNGREVIVKITAQSTNDSKSWLGLAKFAWSGSVIECPNCGEIFRARQYWYGNSNPEDKAVRSEIVHVWKSGKVSGELPAHSAQMALDGVNYLTETVGKIGAQPLKAVTSWVADKAAPSYWRPNFDIIVCNSCKINFEHNDLRKHHCRACGEGYCNQCSTSEMPVPARGWPYPVRVCDSCKEILAKKHDACPDQIQRIINSPAGSVSNGLDEQDVRVRRYGEVVVNTLSTVRTVFDYPKDFIKESARPSYWVPDTEAPDCSVCKSTFGTAEELSAKLEQSRSSPLRILCDRLRHHCRSCGQAVCENCSKGRRPVPDRGWMSDVRVCDPCNKPDALC